MEKIKKFIVDHKLSIQIDESTYISDHKKCRFVDPEYGEFWTLPYSILKGATKGYPKGRFVRAKATNMERYGVENPSQNQDVINKIKKTNTTSASDVQKRIQAINPKLSIKEDTYINTHSPCLIIDSTLGEFWCRPHNILTGAQKGHPDAERAPHDEEAAKAKREKTMVELYGERQALKVQKFKDKARRTTLERFGYEYAAKSEEIRKKIGNASRGRPFKSPEKLRIPLCDIERRCKKTNPKISIDRDSYIDTKTKCKFTEDGVGEFWAAPEYVMSGHVAGHPDTSWDRSHAARKKNGTLWASRAEMELDAVIKNLGLDTEKRRKNGYEIDIYIPSLKIGIEYNGLYWHNEDRLGKHYHLIKTQKAKADGIRIIHVWEHEWLYKRAELLNFLHGALLTGKSTGARKCEFRPVGVDLAKEFCAKNHLRGQPVGVSLALGVFNNGDLVGVATFGANPRNNSEINLTRLCFLNNVHVAGALSKFSKMASEYFKAPIFTFVELDKSDGNSYVKSGWVVTRSLKPDYFYANLKNSTTVSKQSRKKKTAKTPSNLTEAEHARINGLVRVWDCGKLKLVFNSTPTDR